METTAAMATPDISFTRLKTFRQCPKLYEHIYIEGNERADNENMAYGRKVHKLLEMMCRNLLLNETGVRRQIDPAELEEWYDKVRGDIGLEEFEKWRLLKVAEFLSDKDFSTGDIEVEITLDIGLPNKVKGIIDLRCFDKEGNLLIIDWKTIKRSVDEDEIADDLQLKIYAHLMAEHYKDMPWLKIERGLWFWRYGGFVSVPWEPENFAEELKQYVTTLIDTKEFTYQINSYCASCPILTKCKANDEITVYTYGHCKDRAKWWDAKAKDVRVKCEAKFEEIEEDFYIEDGYRYKLTETNETSTDMAMLFSMQGIDPAAILEMANAMQAMVDPGSPAAVQLESMIDQLKDMKAAIDKLTPLLSIGKKVAKAAGIDLPLKDEGKSPRLTYTKV